MLRVCCLLLALVAAVHGACQEPFHQVGEGCYYFSFKDDLVLSWPEAREHCQALGNDVDLAVLDYLCHDYHHIANYIIMEDVLVTMLSMHIGADGYDASWFWLDGRALSPNAIYWYETQPTVAAGCVFLYPVKPHTYKKVFLGKNLCSYERPFVCQKGVHARR